MPGPACIYCRPQGKVMLSEACVSHFVRGRRVSFWRENPCGQIPPPPAATAVVSKQPIGMHSSYANKTSTVVAIKNPQTRNTLLSTGAVTIFVLYNLDETI